MRLTAQCIIQGDACDACDACDVSVTLLNRTNNKKGAKHGRNSLYEYNIK